MNPLTLRENPALDATFLLVDAQGVIVHAEPGVEAFLGLPRDVCVGSRAERLFPGDELQAALGEVRRLGARRTLSIEHGSSRLLASLAPVPGAPWLSLLLAPGDAGAKFEAELVARLRTTIDQVVSGFAHEVRNPVAAILSLTEAAILLSSEAKVTAMLTRIPALVDRVDKLIKQAVSYSRPRPPQRRQEPLRRLLGWAIELSRVREKCANFTVEIDPRVKFAFADAEQIERVIVNLLNNAREAARSRVSLRAFPDAEHAGAVVVEVGDDGEGVASADREAIFEPFFTTKPSGTGLGLAIARDLARLNGGELILASTSGQGTFFRLYLEGSAPGQEAP